MHPGACAVLTVGIMWTGKDHDKHLAESDMNDL